MNDQHNAEVSQMWLARARSDLRLVELAINTSGILLEDICFHAQQCAEKALKAFLVSINVSFPRTHAIDVLLDLVKNAGVHVPEDVDEAFTLTQYAVQTRYPGNWDPVSQEEAQKSLAMAARVLNWVEENLSE